MMDQSQTGSCISYSKSDAFFSCTWDPRFVHLPRDSKFRSPRKVCNYCNRKASQWVHADKTDTAPELWSSRCHQHRVRARDLSPGQKLVSRSELRTIETVASVMDP